jgi:hypothetical protein
LRDIMFLLILVADLLFDVVTPQCCGWINIVFGQVFVTQRAIQACGYLMFLVGVVGSICNGKGINAEVDKPFSHESRQAPFQPRRTRSIKGT